jgi:predicted nucleotidyltransferase
MRTAGVVAEFNPFHNGHRLLIKRARETLGGDAAVVCVMSGDFVQRGEAAVWSKFARAEAAVRCGADLVFELPLPWALSSAEGFARGGVGLLASLGVVDCLVFGSECGQTGPLERAAEALLDPGFPAALRAQLEGGAPFAAARQRALAALTDEQTASVLDTPNNILAVEYIRAVYELGLDLGLAAVRREGAAHDGPGSGSFRSASELRSRLAAGKDCSAFMPDAAAAVFGREAERGRGPVLMQALEPMLLSRLRMLPDAEFGRLPDASEGLGNRLCAAVREEPSLDGVLSAAKSKRYALSRIRRMTMCACLGLREGMADEAPPYARLLAANERGRALLRLIADRGRIPVITKPAAARQLPKEALAVFELGAGARDLYVLGYRAAAERRGGSDWRSGPALV